MVTKALPTAAGDRRLARCAALWRCCCSLGHFCGLIQRARAAASAGRAVSLQLYTSRNSGRDAGVFGIGAAARQATCRTVSRRGSIARWLGGGAVFICGLGMASSFGALLALVFRPGRASRRSTRRRPPMRWRWSRRTGDGRWRCSSLPGPWGSPAVGVSRGAGVVRPR
jgi:hypothetical protein